MMLRMRKIIGQVQKVDVDHVEVINQIRQLGANITTIQDQSKGEILKKLSFDKCNILASSILLEESNKKAKSALNWR